MQDFSYGQAYADWQAELRASARPRPPIVPDDRRPRPTRSRRLVSVAALHLRGLRTRVRRARAA